jgi:hypothetical protein
VLAVSWRLAYVRRHVRKPRVYLVWAGEFDRQKLRVASAEEARKDREKERKRGKKKNRRREWRVCGAIVIGWRWIRRKESKSPLYADVQRMNRGISARLPGEPKRTLGNAGKNGHSPITAGVFTGAARLCGQCGQRQSNPYQGSSDRGRQILRYRYFFFFTAR